MLLKPFTLVGDNELRLHLYSAAYSSKANDLYLKAFYNTGMTIQREADRGVACQNMLLGIRNRRKIAKYSAKEAEFIRYMREKMRFIREMILSISEGEQELRDLQRIANLAEKLGNYETQDRVLARLARLEKIVREKRKLFEETDRAAGLKFYLENLR